MLNENFFSPQVKRSAIISNKHDTFELSKKLKNNLSLTIFTPRHFRRWEGKCPHKKKKKSLTILENLEISGKSQNFVNNSLVSSPTPKTKILSILAKNCWKMEIELFSQCAISRES